MEYNPQVLSIGGGSWTTIPLELTPEKRYPNAGNGLFVFALADE